MRIAVLIDYENIVRSLRDMYNTGFNLDLFMAWVNNFARENSINFITANAYADFDNDTLQGHMSQLQRRGIEPKHVFSKCYDNTRKNAADIEMSLDALALTYETPEIETFILVSGDRDLLQVVRRLEKRDKIVYVLGVESTTSSDLLSFRRFIPLEQILHIKSTEADEVANIIRTLYEKEAQMPFVALKWFMRRFGGEPMSKDVYDRFNNLIINKVITTFQVPNPKNEEHKTTACRVNLEHPLVQQVLGVNNPKTSKDDVLLLPAHLPITSLAAS